MHLFNVFHAERMEKEGTLKRMFISSPDFNSSHHLPHMTSTHHITSLTRLQLITSHVVSYRDRHEFAQRIMAAKDECEALKDTYADILQVGWVKSHVCVVHACVL